MKVRYRFLEDNNDIFGMVFDGFDTFIEEGDDRSSFIYGRMEKTFYLNNNLNKMSDIDILVLFRYKKAKWGEIKEIDVPIREQEEWIPDDLLINRRIHRDAENERKKPHPTTKSGLVNFLCP